MSVLEESYRKRQTKRFPHHECELPAHPDRVDLPIPGRSSTWRVVQTAIQRQLVAWKLSPVVRRLRPSTFSLESEQARQVRARYWWVIHPYSRFWMLWQLLMIATIIPFLLVCPLHFAFADYRRSLYVTAKLTAIHYVAFLDRSKANVQRYEEDISYLRDFTKNTLEYTNGIFYIHMLLLCLTGYHDELRDTIVLQPFLIWKRYFTTWFVVDLFSLIRYKSTSDDVASFGYAENSMYNYIDRRIHLILYETILVIRLCRARYSFIYIRNWCGVASLRSVTISFIIYILSYVLFLQWSAYLSYKVPILVNGVFVFRNDSRSWLNDPEIGFFDLKFRPAWVRQYILCFHRVLLASGRYLHVTSWGKNTPEDCILLLIIMWVGIGFNVVLVSLSLQFVESNANDTLTLAKIKAQVRTYMKDKNLPIHLRHRMLLYYDLKFKDRFFNERAILANMPRNVRETIRKAFCRRMVATSRLFRSVPKPLVERIVAELREELYLPNDVVYAAGDAATALYFLSTGTAAVYSRTGEELGHLDDGDCFGEMGLVLRAHGRRRLESVVAVEVCEMFRLHKRAFKSIVKKSQRLYSRIRAIALTRSADLLLDDDYSFRSGEHS